MAIDVYLQIEGIKGESADSAHQGWIELTSAQWGVLQPKSATASTGGGHTAERCEHQSVSITKLADISSPIFMQTCSSGRTIPKAKLEFMRADSEGNPVKYYEVAASLVSAISAWPVVQPTKITSRTRPDWRWMSVRCVRMDVKSR